MRYEGISAGRTARVAMTIAIAAVVAAGLFIAPISPAQALCWDDGQPYGYTWGIHGTEWHRYSSTCNDDGWYAGKYKDSTTPNQSCMWIKYLDDGIYKITSQNCTSTYKNYTYFDVNHITPTWICDGYGCSSEQTNQGF